MDQITGNFKNTFYQIYTNVIDMLKDRKLIIKGNHPLSKDDFFKQYTTQQVIIFAQSKIKSKTAVFISKMQRSFIKEHLEEVIKLIKGTGVQNLICVVHKRLNDQAIKVDKLKVSFLYHWELYSNPTKHFLVPTHELLSEEAEIDLFKNSTFGDKSKLPKIKISDPICRWFGAKLGNVFMIRRNVLDGSALFEISYRVVSN